MTTLAPQQLRELADALLGPMPMAQLDKTFAALRTAADTLEAVEREAREWIAAPADENAPARAAGEVFLAILTADTAPQEATND